MTGLSAIANLIGLHDDGLIWMRRANSLIRRMMTDLWDNEAGLFWPLVDEKPVKVVTPFSLFPLWTGLLPAAVNQRIVKHLVNTDEFGGEFVIPTVARNQPQFNPERMWRGPVWANVNYFFIEALTKTGFNDLADHLRNQTLYLIMRNHGMFEYYDSVTGTPPLTAASNFGWTASVFIDLAIQAYRSETASLTKGSI
jgi:glycogen debranching enzyme